jgi:hypothetical protein
VSVVKGRLDREASTAISLDTAVPPYAGEGRQLILLRHQQTPDHADHADQVGNRKTDAPNDLTTPAALTILDQPGHGGRDG